jgi:hypothetical protein
MVGSRKLLPNGSEEFLPNFRSTTLNADHCLQTLHSLFLSQIRKWRDYLRSCVKCYKFKRNNEIDVRIGGSDHSGPAAGGDQAGRYGGGDQPSRYGSGDQADRPASGGESVSTRHDGLIRLLLQSRQETAMKIGSFGWGGGGGGGRRKRGWGGAQLMCNCALWCLDFPLCGLDDGHL